MTTKRFTEIISVEKVIDTETGKEYKCIIDSELLELLNDLHEKNQQQAMEYATDLNRLSEENEQLKKELDCFKPLIFETDGMPITLYEKKDGGDVE